MGGRNGSVSASLLSHGAKEVYEEYYANGKSTDAQIYHQTWRKVMNPLIRRFYNNKRVPKSTWSSDPSLKTPNQYELKLNARF